MAVRTYDPKQVIITVGGVPMSGFADGPSCSSTEMIINGQKLPVRMAPVPVSRATIALEI